MSPRISPVAADQVMGEPLGPMRPNFTGITSGTLSGWLSVGRVVWLRVSR